MKNFFLFNNKTENSKDLNYGGFDHYKEIAKLVKEGRIKQNLTIEELSSISKIPQKTIKSIENNSKNIRPKYPFIRSILIKLEECLLLKKNTLVQLAIKEKENFKKEKKDFLVSKFDLINTWQGSLLYFFILVLSIFILRRSFILNVDLIEINNIENLRPKYPFIRSILFKLEDCLALKKNTLVNFLIRERETFKREKKEFFVSKFDLINTWQGSLLYFFILILTIFLLKRYFILNVNVIEIQSIENKIIDK